MKNSNVFPNIESPEPSKSFNDLSHRLNTTLAPGCVIPMRATEVLPGDHFKYNVAGRLESFPMLAPCLDGFKFRVTSHFFPLANCYGFLDNNSRLSTSDLISSFNFWRAALLFAPCDIVNSTKSGTDPNINYGNSTLVHPVEGIMSSAIETGGLHGFNTDEAMASNINRLGVGAGSLLNYLGLPAGYSALGASATYGSITTWCYETTANEDWNDILPSVTMNLHKIFAYMDSYRSALVNNQENVCYFVGTGVESRNVSITGASNSAWFLCYKYYPITLQSLDAFFMCLRSFTQSPKFEPTSGAPFDLDLTNPGSFGIFLEYFTTHMWSYCGLGVPLSGSVTQAHRDALSALIYFLSAAGLSKYYFAYCEQSNDPWCAPYLYFTNEREIYSFMFSPQVTNGNLLLTTYEMDLNRGLLSTSVGLVKSYVQSTDNQFSIDVFRFRNSVQKVIDKFDISGGRFSNWLREFWSVKSNMRIDTAQLLHVYSTYLGNTDIISQSATDKAELAQQAGYTIGSVKSDSDTFTSDEYGIFIQLAALIPVVSYAQGISPDNFRLSLSDLFMPQYANIGFQDVPAKYLYSLRYVPSAQTPGNFGSELSLGFDDVIARRPAWQDYRAAVDVSNGLFSTGAPLNYWTLQRYYVYLASEPQQPLKLQEFISSPLCQYYYGNPSFSTYVFPRMYNYLFTVTDDSAQNFRFAGTLTLKGTRVIPAPSMPSL